MLTKAIRKAHEVDCIRYNNNPEEFIKAYAELTERKVIRHFRYDTFLWIRHSYGDLTINNGCWLVFSNDDLVFTDEEFKEQFEIS